MRTTFLAFSMAVLGFYLLLWGSQMLFPGGTASTVVLVLTTLVGIACVQPGWNIRPSRPVGYWAVLFGLLLGSAALAASVLRLSKIPTPYDTTSLNIVTLLLGIMAVTGVEELLFRQVLFRWLEQQRISVKGAVLATAVAFGGAHLGPMLTSTQVNGPFYLLQSLYMMWVGLLLGELRRVSGSWAISWVGHIAYNVAVLFLLSQQ
jgi:hypothetical protein